MSHTLVYTLLHTAHAITYSASLTLDTIASVSGSAVTAPDVASGPALVENIRRQLMRDNYDYIEGARASRDAPEGRGRAGAPLLRLEQSLHTIIQLVPRDETHAPHTTPTTLSVSEGAEKYKTSLNMNRLRAGDNRQQQDTTTESRVQVTRSDLYDDDDKHLRRTNVLSVGTSVVTPRYYTDNLSISYDAEYVTDKTTMINSHEELKFHSNKYNKVGLSRQHNYNKKHHNKENNNRYDNSNSDQVDEQHTIQDQVEYNTNDDENEPFTESTHINNTEEQNIEKNKQHEKMDNENLSHDISSDDVVNRPEDYRHQVQQEGLTRPTNSSVQRRHSDTDREGQVKSKEINDSDNKISNDNVNIHVTNNNIVEGNSSDNVESDITTEKLIYKLIKVRSGRGTRRGGADSQWRLLERNSRGMAIIALDPAPLPQFGLPPSRHVYSTTTPNSSLVLLDVIKKSLRRNNDDYEVDTSPAVSVTTLTADRSALSHTDRSLVTAVTVPNTEASVMLFKKNTRKHNLWQAASNGRSTTDTNRKRLLRKNKWKRILKKNKMLRILTRSSSIVSSSVPTLMMEMVGGKPAGRTPRLHSLFPVHVPGDNRASPNADQLDMAPARGAYINNLRAKNRFCHRHVLWPEGPKYDGSGNTIMPIYNPKWYDGRDFSQTRKPRFVLPLCCNCCKKSVLGCQ